MQRPKHGQQQGAITKTTFHGIRWSVIGLIIMAISWFVVAQVQAALTGTLPGSSFESGDGNLVANQAGATDWLSPGTAGPVAIGCDLPDSGCFTAQGKSVPSADNSFGQGSKENIPNPTVVTGSIPPNKSDLTRFLEAHETLTNGHIAAYLGWERANVLGSANMDIEFNQSKTLDGDGVVPVRTPGDVLVGFDFTNGGSVPTLSLDRWVTSASVPTPSGAYASGNKCIVYDSQNGTLSSSSNSFPCWGDGQLLGASIANGAVNSASVTDTLLPSDPQSLPAGTFGETGIDLTAAGVFVPGQCVNLGSAYLKSRSSASFGAELKDFVAPTPVNINNCGNLVVHKYIDVNGNGTKDTGDVNGSGWQFTVSGPSPSATQICSGTTGSDGTLVCSTGSLSGIQPGTYTVNETQSAGFYNTDPGSGSASDRVNEGTTLTKTADVPLGATATVEFGNDCYVAKTFRINQIPAGTAPLFVSYTVVSGHDAGSTDSNVPLTTSGSSATATVSNIFVQSDTINWSWGITGQSTLAAGATNESFASDTYPGCSVTNSTNFLFSTITGFKYKDVNNNGAFNPGTDTVGAGFTFQLKNAGGAVVTTTTSDASGNFSFGNLAPGTYTIHEDLSGNPGWVQTEPASGADRTITVNLGDQSINAGNWGDTPTYDFSMNFHSDANLPGTSTAATHGSITCTPSPANSAGSSTGSYSSGTQQGGSATYNCSLVVTDP